MTRYATFVGLGLLAVCLCVMTTSRVCARPEYKARFLELTKNSKAADLIKEANCNVCHYGKVKKNRNDFGQAVNRHINEDQYKTQRADKDAFAKKIDAVLKAVLKEKSKSDKTFGELIESGSLPAVNPDE